jgi:hypothetical protein
MKKILFKSLISTAVLLTVLIVQTPCQSIKQNSLVISKRDMLLWYKQPGKQWTEGLPIGNGYMGAMIFGRIQNERIVLNESTFWSGRPHDYTISRYGIENISATSGVLGVFKRGNANF